MEYQKILVEFEKDERVIYIRYPGIGVLRLNLTDETNLGVLDMILDRIRTSIKEAK